MTRRGFRSPSARHIVPSPRGLTLTRVEVGRLRPTCVPAGLRVAVKRVIANADETESCDSDARRICDFRCDVNGLSVRVRPLGGQEFDSLQMVRVAILERGRRISRPASQHSGRSAGGRDAIAQPVSFGRAPAGVAWQPGGRRLRRLRLGGRHVRIACRAGHGGRRRGRPGLPRSRVREHRGVLRRPRHLRSCVPPHLGRSWLAGARRAVVLRRPAAVPATLLTSSTSGFLHWTAGTQVRRLPRCGWWPRRLVGRRRPVGAGS